MPSMPGRKGASAALALAAAACLPAGCDRPEPPRDTALQFQERAEATGLGRTEQSYAAAAADFDRDGWPDLAVSRHGHIGLHRNIEGQGFEDVSDIGQFERGDTHGISWLDWNRDGWPDLYVSRGALRGRIKRGNRLHLNREGRSFELADLPDAAANGSGRGRSATPWDLNGDGRLDLMILNFHQPDRPQVLALSGDDGYRDAARDTGWHGLRAETATAFRLGGETVFVLTGYDSDAGHIYRRDEAGRFVDITREAGVRLEPGTTVTAVAVGDVNNDGRDDLYFVRAPRRGQGAAMSDQGLEFRYTKGMTTDQAGLRFKANGAFTLQVWSEGRARHSRLFLGAGAKPAGEPEVRVEATDAALDGAPSLNGAKGGAYAWRTGPGAYELRYVPGRDGPQEMTGRLVAADGGLELAGQYGDFSLGGTAPNQLYLQRDGRLHESGEAADPRSGRGALFADFDNDGDLDLYVLNGGTLFDNPPNRVFENRGGGEFADVTELSGGAGSAHGRGDTVLSFDYDRDGRMDLFLTNGEGAPPRRHEGPYELYRNTARAGHWLRVNLEATASNPMALGARVTVVTDGVTQHRFVSAATGALATSWLPLHFGLGDAAAADVTVHWPSGRTQHQRVDANTLVTITEPGGS